MLYFLLLIELCMADLAFIVYIACTKCIVVFIQVAVLLLGFIPEKKKSKLNPLFVCQDVRATTALWSEVYIELLYIDILRFSA